MAFNSPTVQVSADISAMQFCTRILLVVSLMLLAAGLLWRSVGYNYFGLEKIVVVVDDVERYETGHLGQSFHLRNANLFTVDLDKVRTLIESKPWVHKAAVRRHFPNALRVEIESNQVRGYWYEGQTRRLVNQKGEVFNAPWTTADSVRAGKLPVMRGAPELSVRTWDLHQRIEPRLKSIGLNIAELAVSQQGSWRAALNGGATLYLGKGELQEVEQRLLDFVLTIERVTKSYAGGAAKSLESADLRYQKGYAIRLRRGSQALQKG